MLILISGRADDVPTRHQCDQRVAKGTRTNTGVAAFFAKLNSNDIYLAVQTIGEIRSSVENIRKQGDRLQAEQLEAWLDRVVASHAMRLLGFDLECSQVWGTLISPNPQHPIDKQIAAIALIYDLTVVTRNTADFESAGARLYNPLHMSPGRRERPGSTYYATELCNDVQAAKEAAQRLGGSSVLALVLAGASD